MIRTINGVDLVMTCGACPEQYDAFIGNEQVGYLRLRGGDFRVDYPRCGGETIYEAQPDGDGDFLDFERDRYLVDAVGAILARRAGLPADQVGPYVRDVAAFHGACGVPVLATATFVPERAELRRTIIAEEAREVDEAIASGVLPDIAKELADLVYVALGTALEFGIPFSAVWAEVQRSNMSKLDPITGKALKRADGKVLKGPNYAAPDIGAVLAREA